MFAAGYVAARAAGAGPRRRLRASHVARRARARHGGEDRDRRRPTEHGVYAVDVETDVVLGPGRPVEPQLVQTGLPLVIAAAAAGATVIAVVDRRPPLAISNDGGRTWREAGGGLPAGKAIAIDEDNPGPRALRRAQPASPLPGRRPLLEALTVELPEIEAVAWRP